MNYNCLTVILSVLHGTDDVRMTSFHFTVFASLCRFPLSRLLLSSALKLSSLLAFTSFLFSLLLFLIYRILGQFCITSLECENYRVEINWVPGPGPSTVGEVFCLRKRIRWQRDFISKKLEGRRHFYQNILKINKK